MAFYISYFCPQQSYGVVVSHTGINQFCEIIFPYAVTMYCSHWLIIKTVWPAARQDKFRGNNQTEDSDEGGRVRGDMSQPPKEQDVRGPVRHRPYGNRLIEVILNVRSSY